MIDNSKIASLLGHSGTCLKGKNNFPKNSLSQTLRESLLKSEIRNQYYGLRLCRMKDLGEATALISQAKEGILFLCSIQARGGRSNAIVERNYLLIHYKRNLYIHGVLNQTCTEKNPIVGLSIVVNTPLPILMCYCQRP